MASLPSLHSYFTTRPFVCAFAITSLSDAGVRRLGRMIKPVVTDEQRRWNRHSGMYCIGRVRGLIDLLAVSDGQGTGSRVFVFAQLEDADDGGWRAGSMCTAEWNSQTKWQGSMQYII